MQDYIKTFDMRMFWIAVLLLLLPLPALLVGLSEADNTRHMEALTLATSQETWLRQHSGEQGAWILPTRNGELRVRKPPASVWMNLLAWTGLGPDETVPADLIYRARIVAVALGLAMILSIFWIGLRMRGAALGIAAALVAASSHAFLDQARLASYDTHLMAWSALAVACALAAMRADGRGRLLIVPAAICIGLAYLTKGPVSLVHTFLPLAAMSVLIERPVRQRLATLAAVTVLGLLIALPWYQHMLAAQAGAASTLAAEYAAERSATQPPWYYLGLLGMMAPWTIWMVVGLFAPFSNLNSAKEKREMLLPWLWLVAVVVVMSIPGAKQQRYIVPVIPAAALVVGNAWLAADFRRRGMRIARRVHWSLLGLASLLLPVFMVLQEKLISLDLIEDYELPGANWPEAVATGVILVGIVVAGTLLHLRGKAMSALLASACWMVCAFTSVHIHYSQSYHAIYEQEDDCRRVLERIGDSPLFYLEDGIGRKDSPDEKFLLYTRRVLEPVSPTDIAGSKAQYVMVMRTPEKESLMRGVGYRKLFDFDDGRASRALYERRHR